MSTLLRPGPPVGVSVPATTANLGPGFDSLGLALEYRDELTAQVLETGLEVVVEGEGVDGVPLDESHLVVRTIMRTLALLDAEAPGLRLVCRNRIPHARGMGSSSAAIVAGVWLGRALVPGGAELLDDDAAFRLAADIEGHPDNVAPAWFGGFTIAGHDDGWFAVGSPVDPRIETVVLVPPTPLSTEAARGLLPASVPHADAAADAGRAALVVAALAQRPDQLLRATHDRLHQEYRRPAMPESLALIDRLRAAGVPAVVSGAGPTVLALVSRTADAGLPHPDDVVAHCPAGWASHVLAVAPAGVRAAH